MLIALWFLLLNMCPSRRHFLCNDMLKKEKPSISLDCLQLLQQDSSPLC